MLSDYELLYLASEDIDAVVDILFKKYQKLIYLKIQKYNSSRPNFEDYLNEAMLSLYEAVENYQDKNSFGTYLNKCIDSSLINYKKRTTRNKNKILSEAISLDDDNLSIIPVSEKNYNPEIILYEEYDYESLKKEIIDKLTWKEELVFVLKEQDFTCKEISEITDNNLRTVYNIISRIKKKMSKIMSNRENTN